MRRMDFFGVRATEQKTAGSAVVTAQTGVMAFGTAPVHQTGGKVNEVVRVSNYQEAVEAFGWSEDWEKYTLCEVIHSHFKLYGVGPLLLVNVLDPDKHKGESKEETLPVSNGQIRLSGDTIEGSITVQQEAEVYEKGQDYDVFYQDGECVIEILTGGKIQANVESLVVGHCEVDFQLKDMKSAVIGGYDVKKGESSGIELADQAYFKTKVLPDILIAPGFSHEEEVAAVLAAKAKSLSMVFRSFALCDLPGETYQETVKAKEEIGCFRAEKERVLWPMLKKDGKQYHYSTQLASLMALLAANNGGIPVEPASNKVLQADAAVLKDGTEVNLDLNQANYLRGQGITTALSFINGFTAWGEYCACVPQNSDPKDRFCSGARMVNYVTNTIILSFWKRIDEAMTSRFASSIVDQINIWLNGLSNPSVGALLGARCELKSEENPEDDLAAGIIRPHIYLAVPGPAQVIDFIVEYDTSYVKSLLG